MFNGVLFQKNFIPYYEKLLIAALLSSCIAPLASAQIVQTKMFGPSIPQFSTVMTFNSCAGDLDDIESIVVTWEMHINDGYLVVDNDAVDPATGSYEFGVSLGVDAASTDVTLLDGSFTAIFTNTEVINSGSFSLAANDGDGPGDFSPDGADAITVDGEEEFGSGGGSINALFHDEYVNGTGGTAGSTFDIGIDALQYLNVNSNGGTEYAITPVNANGIVKVVYNLKPVPEPSSAAMLALGSLVLLRRKR